MAEIFAWDSLPPAALIPEWIRGEGTLSHSSAAHHEKPILSGFTGIIGISDSDET